MVRRPSRRAYVGQWLLLAGVVALGGDGLLEPLPRLVHAVVVRGQQAKLEVAETEGVLQGRA